MEEGNSHKLNFNQTMESGETCESCKVPVMANCRSCGMPMTSPESYGGGNTDNTCCVHCCRPDGSLKNYDDVLEGMTGLMMNTRGMDRAAAESAARKYLVTMPAWSGR